MLFTVTFLSASARFDVLMHKSTVHPLILVQAPEMCRRPHTYQKNYPPWNESISHLGKRKIIDSKVLFSGGDMLVSFRRVSFFKHPKVNLFFVVHLSSHSPRSSALPPQFQKKGHEPKIQVSGPSSGQKCWEKGRNFMTHDLAG